jgi:aminoglycoside phosphotransferase family enzyme/predicted kinase
MTLAQPSDSANSCQLVDSVVNLLNSPTSYAEQTGKVVHLETHISHVFLTDRHVYKLKKPVRFDFLDYSTPEKREWACQREVELNRRLARDVYVGVIPITQGRKGRLRLGGTGEPVDWVVKMRRLPTDRTLDQLIRTRTFAKSDTKELAVQLARFYQELPPLNINIEVYRRRIEEHIRSNELELARPEYEFDRAMLKRIHVAQLRLLRLAPEILDARVCDGRIVDGHGDLRPEHIYFAPQPTIIDCIEFNEEFRQLDVLDELAFLAAECEHLGAAQIGDRIIDEYRTTCRDSFPQSLLHFYKCYRACVRAKVLLLRGSQVVDSVRDECRADARSYLQLADNHASKLSPPVLLVVYGLSGTGKTNLSRKIADCLDVDLFSTDAIRQQLFEHSSHALHDESRYHPAKRQQVYDEMFKRAHVLLSDKLSVVLDGTFHAAALRQRAVELARRMNAEPHLIHCCCPPEVATERITARNLNGGSLSDATAEVYRRQLEQFEADTPQLPVHVVDTNRSLAEISQGAFDQLKSWML